MDTDYYSKNKMAVEAKEKERPGYFTAGFRQNLFI